MLFRALAVRSPLQYWPLLWCMMGAPPWAQRKGMACWLMDWKHGKNGNKENWMIFVTPPMQRSPRSRSCSRPIGLTSTRDGSQFSVEMLAVSNNQFPTGTIKEPKKTRITFTFDGPPPPRDWPGECWKPCIASAASAPSDSCTSSWCCFGMCGLVGWMASSQVASIGKIVSKQSKIDTNLVKYFEEEKAWWFPFARISTEAAVATAVPQRLWLLRSATLFWRRTLHVCISVWAWANKSSARILMCCSHPARQGRHIKRFLQRCGGPPARSPPTLCRPGWTTTEKKSLSSKFLFKFCQLITHDLSVNAHPDRTTLRRCQTDLNQCREL